MKNDEELWKIRKAVALDIRRMTRTRSRCTILVCSVVEKTNVRARKEKSMKKTYQVSAVFNT